MTTYSVTAPALPEHDRSNPVEGAIINGLVRTWPRRATVKKKEPELDDLFDPAKADFPEEMIPFHDHECFLGLNGTQQDRLRAWAWIAYNKNVMDIEQFVVNPGFGLLSRDELDVGFGDKHKVAALQAMVDEEYHTLMHLNASALTRRRRGWQLPDNLLPRSLTVREHDSSIAAASSRREAALVRVAFTTAAETSISGYLALMTDSEAVQSVNRSTVALHRRDELSHSSVAGELVRAVYDTLNHADRRVLITTLGRGIEAFAGNDFTTWRAILDAEEIPGASRIMADVEAAAASRVVQDCSAIRALCRDLGIEDEVGVEW
ncbi:diiron oxygenase [Antrihabitans sp. YC2-6]|uniref:AurF N-oxygenase family protein n=1 Tax=Antrihabitans sp. YC2-6 TaxID=2799498 RepID=UPI0018F3F44C|nr:diiron oxygenase [Antrihabitans sp. YC2-6]MBJ8343164.1 diiron oxygenase [Antrihabitans sp. YC2-6]